MYGRPVDIAADPANRRRTIYGLVDRQGLPAFFRAFDFANPDQSAERRTLTTVPQQALFGLNSPFMLEQAKALANSPEVAGAREDGGRIRALYRLVLQRAPDAAEIREGTDYLASLRQTPAAPNEPSPLEQYAQALLVTNEVMFLD
jgi:hypothetical protein